ncbi:hypothetical protein BV22DRAFT_1078382 [Leucogyrophana mollusca]|uniref:Uncharacterized protein n=1 Tax=Leucogyrophana mollusca TaxID=85980 RepID=A0ACB8BYV1_9AGAM|nr:hypothetical protein BV22DRAFT_1078382 [Leucogyrophana mollusca]
MIEPLAAAVVKSLLLRCASTGRAATLKSAFDPMGQRIRPAFPRDFFTPHVRGWKGKEKALDEQGVECRQCTQWPSSEGDTCCAMKHSLWCPRRNRLLMINEVIPRRSRPSRRAAGQHFTRRCLSSFQPRQHSSPLPRTYHPSAVAPTSPAPVVEEPHVPPDPPSRLRELLAGSEGFSPEKAWGVYVSMAPGHRRTLEPTEVLRFSHRLLSIVEQGYQEKPVLKSLQQWGSRFGDLLQDLETTLTRGSPVHISCLCLLARAHALIGDLPQAIATAHEVMSFPLDDNEESSLLEVFQSLILSTKLHHNPTHVLDLLIKEWDFAGPHLQSRSSQHRPQDVAAQSISFRKTAFSILADIANPAAVLSERWAWAPETRQRLSELLWEVYCSQDLPDDAYALMDEMRRQRLPAKLNFRLHLVRALVRADSYSRANKVFASLSLDVSPGSAFQFYISTGLYLFAHQGDIARAEEYYNQLHQSRWTSANDKAMLLHAYAVNGRVERVVDLFHEFFPANAAHAARPNIVHYTTVIFAHSQRADFDGLNHWLEAMTKDGITPDVYVYNIVLKSFAMRGEVESVAAILDQMRRAQIQPTHVLYTTVITLLARRRDPISAEAIYKRALREGVAPDRRMITALMNAHVEAGSWRGVIRVFDYLKSSRSRRIGLSIEVYNTLLKAYVLIGAPFRVVSSLFRRLEDSGVRPDAHSYTTLIQSACDAGYMDIASNIFVEMEEAAQNWRSAFRIDAYVLTIIMAGHLRLGDKASAKAVYDSMRERGIQPTSNTFGNILQAYGNERTQESLQIAETFLKSIMDVEPSERVWMTSNTRQLALEHVYRPLMLVYTRQQKPEDVERLFQDMLDAGGEPSLGTLTVLLDAYRRTFDIQSVHDVWPQIWQLALRLSKVDSLFDGDNTDTTDPMERQANLLCIPLSIYIDALSAAGQHLTIPEVWAKARSQGFNFDSHNWNHLAVALVRAGEPERAFEVIERVILPYQHQSRLALGARDISPESPLTFDIHPPSVDDPASEAPMHRADRRASQVALATRKSGSSLDMQEESDDFAHPLHILHQISPSWHIWCPHTATLDVLSGVLARLQSGMTIQPVMAEGDTPLPVGDGLESEEELARAEMAKDILNRIYTSCPRAVQAVLNHERRERRRQAREALPDGWS